VLRVVVQGFISAPTKAGHMPMTPTTTPLHGALIACSNYIGDQRLIVKRLVRDAGVLFACYVYYERVINASYPCLSCVKRLLLF